MAASILWRGCCRPRGEVGFVGEVLHWSGGAKLVVGCAHTVDAVDGEGSDMHTLLSLLIRAGVTDSKRLFRVRDAKLKDG